MCQFTLCMEKCSTSISAVDRADALHCISQHVSSSKLSWAAAYSTGYTPLYCAAHGQRQQIRIDSFVTSFNSVRLLFVTLKHRSMVSSAVPLKRPRHIVRFQIYSPSRLRIPEVKLFFCAKWSLFSVMSLDQCYSTWGSFVHFKVCADLLLHYDNTDPQGYLLLKSYITGVSMVLVPLEAFLTRVLLAGDLSGPFQQYRMCHDRVNMTSLISRWFPCANN